jgi:hypothetical protein
MTSTRSTHAMDVSSQHSLSRSAKPPAKRTRADAAHPALRLQRLVGNNAVNGALQRGPAGLPQQTSGGLPAALREGIRSLSGMDLCDVRVHVNSAKPAQIDALAYARGNDIYLGPGQERHLPHEAWHIVQQRQGRVLPTTQRGGQAINDDAGLEREADEQGRQAAAGGAHRPTLRRQNSGTATARRGTTVQAIMSVAEFQAATPRGLLTPRKAVTTIDLALGQYIAARSRSNVRKLLAAIDAYTSGQHDAARLRVAGRLRRRAAAEQWVLEHVVGDNNAQSAPASIVDLVVEHWGEDHLPDLPAMIKTIGGITHLPKLVKMIDDNAGVVDVAALVKVIGRHPGELDRPLDLIHAAGGNRAVFARLAEEIPCFKQVVWDGARPPVVDQAVAEYNAAAAGLVVAELTALAAAARSVFNAMLVAPLNNINVPPALVTKSTEKATAFETAIQAMAGPPVTPVALDAAVRLAGELHSLVHHALYNGVRARLNNVPQGFTAAMANVDGRKIAAVQARTGARPISNVAMDHFLFRHTFHHFDFGKLELANTQWDRTWGDQSAVKVAERVAYVLRQLISPPVAWLVPNAPLPNRPLGPLGGTVQIGAQGTPGDQIRIGMFFPHQDLNAGNYDHSDATMRAIEKVL